MNTANPTDTAVAFTDLYRCWSSDARGLTDERTRQAYSLADQYMADVLSLWDTNTHAWLPGAPTILRLESCDIAVFTMRDPHIALHLGSIETDSPVATFGAPARAQHIPTNHSAPYWRSMRPCSYAIGRTLSHLTFGRDGQGRLTYLVAHLDDGGSLCITASGIDCSHPAHANDLALAM